MISPYVYPGIKENSLPSVKKKKRAIITPEKVMGIVAKHCGVTVTDILSRRRKSEMCDARHIFCAIMRREFDYSLKSIGEMVSGRDHTTAIHSIETYNSRCKYEDRYTEVTERILDDMYDRV
jgi:chromosomal replication initiator protein